MVRHRARSRPHIHSLSSRRRQMCQNGSPSVACGRSRTAPRPWGCAPPSRTALREQRWLQTCWTCRRAGNSHAWEAQRRVGWSGQAPVYGSGAGGGIIARPGLARQAAGQPDPATGARSPIVAPFSCARRVSGTTSLPRTHLLCVAAAAQHGCSSSTGSGSCRLLRASDGK